MSRRSDRGQKRYPRRHRHPPRRFSPVEPAGQVPSVLRIGLQNVNGLPVAAGHENQHMVEALLDDAQPFYIRPLACSTCLELRRQTETNPNAARRDIQGDTATLLTGFPRLSILNRPGDRLRGNRPLRGGGMLRQRVRRRRSHPRL